MEVTAIEGVFGLTISLVFLVMFQFIPCDEATGKYGNPQFCPFGVVEDTYFAFLQMGAEQVLLWLVIATSLLIIPEDYSGIFVVKYASGMQRAITKTLRALCVWVFSMPVGWEYFMFEQVLSYS